MSIGIAYHGNLLRNDIYLINKKIIKQNMKLNAKLSLLTAVTIILLSVVSCTSYKEVPYFQNIDQTTLSATQALYDAKADTLALKR